MKHLKTILSFTKINLRKLMLIALASFLTVNVSFAASNKIHIEVSDRTQYKSVNFKKKNNVNTFTVHAGSKVTLTLNHTGKLPIKAMGHNVVILKKQHDTQSINKDYILNKTEATIKIIRKNNGENNLASGEFNNKENKKMLLAYTKMIGEGGSSTITFDAPKKPGAYIFFCSFPSHHVKMYGVMIVEN